MDANLDPALHPSLLGLDLSTDLGHVAHDKDAPEQQLEHEADMILGAYPDHQGPDLQVYDGEGGVGASSVLKVGLVAGPLTSSRPTQGSTPSKASLRLSSDTTRASFKVILLCLRLQVPTLTSVGKSGGVHAGRSPPRPFRRT